MFYADLSFNFCVKESCVPGLTNTVERYIRQIEEGDHTKTLFFSNNLYCTFIEQKLCVNTLYPHSSQGWTLDSISEQQQTEEEDEDTNLFCVCLHCVHQSSPTPNLTTPMDLDL